MTFLFFLQKYLRIFRHEGCQISNFYYKLGIQGGQANIVSEVKSCFKKRHLTGNYPQNNAKTGPISDLYIQVRASGHAHPSNYKITSNR